MEPRYFLLIVLWILAGSFFSWFIVFFDRRKLASVRSGFIYLISFFIAGIGLLFGSLRLLH